MKKREMALQIVIHNVEKISKAIKFYLRMMLNIILDRTYIYRNMIKNSFIFLEKIGLTKEQHLWQQGIKDWQEFLKRDTIKGIPKTKKQYYKRRIAEAQ